MIINLPSTLNKPLAGFIMFAAFFWMADVVAQAPFYKYAQSYSNPATTAVSVGNSIAVDKDANVYTTGYFSGTINFGSFPLTSTGSQDIFITKADASGTVVWARSFGGTGQDRGFGIAVDEAGNVYGTGLYFSTVDFDPGAGVTNLTAGTTSGSCYILKLDAAGNLVKAYTTTGTGGGSGKWNNGGCCGPNLYCR